MHKNRILLLSACFFVLSLLTNVPATEVYQRPSYNSSSRTGFNTSYGNRSSYIPSQRSSAEKSSSSAKIPEAKREPTTAKNTEFEAMISSATFVDVRGPTKERVDVAEHIKTTTPEIIKREQTSSYKSSNWYRKTDHKEETGEPSIQQQPEPISRRNKKSCF